MYFTMTLGRACTLCETLLERHRIHLQVEKFSVAQQGLCILKVDLKYSAIWHIKYLN